MAGELCQIIGQRFAAQHRRTAHANPFAERDNQDIRRDLAGVAATAPLVAAYANTVRIVDHQPAICLSGRQGDVSQRRAVAVHTEHPFGNNQLFATDRFCQQSRKMRGVVMGKAA